MIGTAATGWRRTLAAIGERVDMVDLDTAMTREETRDYIDTRLALARVPQSTRDRFDDDVLERLHVASGGIPGKLHAIATEILQGPVSQEGERPGREESPVDSAAALKENPKWKFGPDEVLRGLTEPPPGSCEMLPNGQTSRQEPRTR